MRRTLAFRVALLLALILAMAFLPTMRGAAVNFDDYSDSSDGEDFESDDDEVAVEVDEYGRVLYDEDQQEYDFEDQELMAGHEAEVYVIDEKVEGSAVATLVLDEVTEYYDEAGQSWFKVQLHMLNSGEVPLCGAVFWVSDPSAIAEAWTLEKMTAGKESNLYKLLWAHNVSTGEARFFGLVTHGDQVPDIGFHAITVCEEADTTDSETDDETDGDRIPSAEHSFGASKDLNTQGQDEEDDNTITLQVDELSEYVLLAVDEVQDWNLKESKSRQVLVNAHVTNTANFPICGISVWIYGFPAVKQYWSVVPIPDQKSAVTDMVYLPSADSDLEPGQTHHFGFIMEIGTDFPNMAVINARDCQAHEAPATKDQAE